MQKTVIYLKDSKNEQNVVNRYPILLSQLSVVDSYIKDSLDPSFDIAIFNDDNFIDFTVDEILKCPNKCKGMILHGYAGGDDNIAHLEKIYTDVIKSLDFVILVSPGYLRMLKKYKINIPYVIIPYPITSDIKSDIPWKDRKNAFIYYGRILPEKFDLTVYKKLVKNGIYFDLFGPICQEYWKDKELSSPEYQKFKAELFEFMKSPLVNYKGTFSLSEVASNIGKYKYYISTSNNEAFCRALQEAMACGVIPFQKWGDAFLWSEETLQRFHTNEELIHGVLSIERNKEKFEYYSKGLSTFTHTFFNPFVLRKRWIKFIKKYL